MVRIDERTGRRKLRGKANWKKAIENSPFSKTDLNLIRQFLEYEEPANEASTLKKKVDHLKAVSRWLNSKPFNALIQADIRTLYLSLKDNTIKTAKGENYSEENKKLILKSFYRFMRYIFRNQLHEDKTQNYELLFGDLKYKKNHDDREPVIIPQEKLKQMVNFASHNMKIILMLGGDSGLRPEELFNVKREHISWDNKNKIYNVFVNAPKTGSRRRTADLGFTSEVMKYWLETSDLKPSDFVVQLVPDYINRQLKEYCKRVGIESTNGKSISIYSLRHSSIQEYVELYRGNIVILANRYGWKYSTAPRRLEDYLARSKVGMPNAGELANQTKIEDVVTQLRVRDAEIEYMREQLKKIERFMESQRKGELIPSGRREFKT